MGAGIGFGKAGNNPYQWLALGGAGLQSMLAGSPTNDPQSLQNDQFLRAATASGQPQTSIPRDVHGLLPMLAQKIGILSPNIQASPDQMNMEKIFLAAKQQADQKEKLSEMVKFLDVVNAAMKQGPEWASKVYRAFPSLETPGITPQDIAAIKTTPEMLEQRKVDAERVREDQRNRALDIQARRVDLMERHLTDVKDKVDKNSGVERRQGFSDMLTYLRGRARNPMSGEVDPNVDKAIGYVMDAQNSGANVPSWAEIQGIMNPPHSPTPIDTSNSLLQSLGHLISNPRTALFGASPAIGAPTNMQPQARPTVVPAKIVPSW